MINLSAAEEITLLRLRRKHRTNLSLGDIVGVRYYHDGNFTACVLSTEYPARTRVGFAKLNPSCDQYDRDRGREIAFARALRAEPQ